MATYLLVHGSFQGAWIWQPTVTLLRAAGHTVYAPTLDGCAERKGAVRAGITVTSVAQELAEMLFYEDLHDVIVAGTSSGGLVVQKLAVLARDRIKHLVFLDALVPQPGESVADIVEHPPGTAPYPSTEFTRAPTRDRFENGLFSELTGQLKDWALDRVTPHPIGLSDAAPGELDDFWQQDWKATVIFCTESPNPPESHQRRTAERLGADWLVLQAGHFPMLTDPEETAKLLQA